jgi:hypothetical protein
MDAGAASEEAQQRRSAWLILGDALTIAGALILLVALVASQPFLVEMVQRLLDVPGLRLTPAPGVVAAGVVILVGAVIVVGAPLGSRRPSWALAAAFGAFVLIRVIAALMLDGPLISDWLLYEQLARGAAQGAPPIADVPMGYPYLLAAGYALLGRDAPVGELLNVGLACAGAALLAVLVERLADRRAAAIAVLVLAICPSQVLYGVILGTEVAYATALVAFALLATLIVHRIQGVGPDRVVLVIAGLAGLLLGASAYVRATSFAIAPFFVLLPVLATGRLRAVAPAMAVMCLAAAIALIPAVSANRDLLDRWSPSTSLYIGWQLYVGSGIEHEGRYNLDDVATLDAAAPGYRVGDLAAAWSAGRIDPEILRAAAIRDDVAMTLALERIADVGPRLLGIIPTKVANAWGPADDAAFWTLARGPQSSRLARAVAAVASQGWWVLVLGAALFGLYRRARGAREALLIVSAFLVPLVLGLLVLEAKARYHEPVVPLLAGVAAIAVTGLRPAADSADPRPTITPRSGSDPPDG